MFIKNLEYTRGLCTSGLMKIFIILTPMNTQPKLMRLILLRHHQMNILLNLMNIEVFFGLNIFFWLFHVYFVVFFCIFRFQFLISLIRQDDYCFYELNK